MRSFQLLKHLTSKQLRATPLPFMPRRSIVSIAELKSVSLPRHHPLSPAHGVALVQSGALSQWYDISKMDEKPSATNQLITAIFHKQGQQLRPTHCKSLPAYSLTHTLLGYIVRNIESLNTEKARLFLHTLWCTQHKEMTHETLARSKMNRLLNLIEASKKECLAGNYLPYITETILSSFLYYKAESSKHIDEYTAILLSQVENNKLPSDTYSIITEDIKRITKQTSKDIEEYLQKKHDELVYEAILQENKVPEVISRPYGYKNKKPKPNCVEAAFHNLCNILLYNKIDRKFDFTLLPTHLTPSEKLKEFYHIQEFDIHSVNLEKIGQSFMNLLSSNPHFSYRSFDYEIIASIENFLPVMNYLFGCDATDIDALTEEFSDENRKVIFKQEHSTVKITIETKNTLPEYLIFKFAPAHAELEIKNPDDTEKCSLLQPFNEWIWSDIKNINKYPTLFLFTPPPFYTSELSAFDEHIKNNGSLSQLQHFLLRYNLAPPSSQLLAGLEIALICSKKYSALTPYILSFCNKLKVDIHYLSVTIKKLHLHQADKTHRKIYEWCLQFPFEYLSCKLDSPKDKAEITQITQSIKEKSNLDTELSSCGFPLLIAAVFYEKTDLLTLLLSTGMNPNISTSHENKTPLMIAAEKKHLTMLTLLIAAGADVNKKDHHGNTALHVALSCDQDYRGYDYLDIHTALLQAGADVHLKNAAGESTYSQAVKHERIQIISLFNEHLKSLDHRTPTP